MEALAPDGQIETISLAAHSGFSLALQWHPRVARVRDATSQKIFAAFGTACQQWRAARSAA